jgi:hypothetical protein
VDFLTRNEKRQIGARLNKWWCEDPGARYTVMRQIMKGVMADLTRIEVVSDYRGDPPDIGTDRVTVEYKHAEEPLPVPQRPP